MNGGVRPRAIASELGAEMKSATSNEAIFKSKNIVIKCAAPATDSVGVIKMLDHKFHRAAFQRTTDSFRRIRLASFGNTGS